MMNVGLRHLQFAVVAAEHGSFRHAAEVLHIRQSTLSRTIQQLEARLDVTLFVRSTSGVRPTAAGIQFLEKAKRLLADVDALVSTAQALSRGKAGRFVLGLPTSFATAMLRTVLLDFANECPDVDIRLVSRPRAGLLADLKADALDLAIVVGGLEEESCESLSLWSERILVAVPLSHPLATRSFAYWTHLIDEVLLMSHRGLDPELRRIMAEKLTSIGKLPRVEEHAIGTEALLSLVAAGRGVTLQCEGTIRATHPGMVRLELHDRTGTSWITYSACWKNHYSNPALSSFLALLRAHRSLLSPTRVPDT
jgi:DNA-binding transcriptional LysR family regulator